MHSLFCYTFAPKLLYEPPDRDRLSGLLSTIVLTLNALPDEVAELLEQATDEGRLTDGLCEEAFERVYPEVRGAREGAEGNGARRGAC